MRTLTGKLALVTGAGSGIGRATALALADERMQIVACDLDESALASVAAELSARGALSMSASVDVSSRDAMRDLADRVHATAPCLDVLVNNAGVAHVGRMIDTPLADWDHVLGVNLGGVIHGCHFFVPRMVRRGTEAHVVNVSSMVGLVALPGTIAYVTSKFAVLGLSEALRAELAPHRIGVTAICPGIVRTNIARSMRITDAGARAHEDTLRRWGPSLGHDPATVARAIVRSIRRDRGTVAVSAESRALYWLKRTSPRASGWLAAAIARMSPGRAQP